MHFIMGRFQIGRVYCFGRLEFDIKRNAFLLLYFLSQLVDQCVIKFLFRANRDLHREMTLQHRETATSSRTMILFLFVWSGMITRYRARSWTGWWSWRWRWTECTAPASRAEGSAAAPSPCCAQAPWRGPYNISRSVPHNPPQ